MERSKIIRKVMAKLAKVKDQVPGGIGDGAADSRFDPKQLEKGIDIELEHTKDEDLAKEISKDHLTEVPNYYIDDEGRDRLKMLEDDAESELE